ncbi:MAG: hypothetical protein ABI782_02790 [Anaerolineaceae bacterium]
MRLRKARWLLAGGGVVVLAGLAAGGWWSVRDDDGGRLASAGDTVVREAASTPKTCAEVKAVPGAKYAPIRVGPISFDPGPDGASGSDIRYLGKTKDGYIIKSFMAIEKFGSGQLLLTGTNVVSGSALTFDYPQELAHDGYRAQMVFPVAQMDRLSLRPPAGLPAPSYWVAPGAWAALELGIYELHVEDGQGKSWSTTVSICHELEFPAPRPQ